MAFKNLLLEFSIIRQQAVNFPDVRSNIPSLDGYFLSRDLITGHRGLGVGWGVKSRTQRRVENTGLIVRPETLSQFFVALPDVILIFEPDGYVYKDTIKIFEKFF